VRELKFLEGYNVLFWGLELWGGREGQVPLPPLATGLMIPDNSCNAALHYRV